ncbi:tRNA-splicing endonuclease [Rhynchospora pubera]|uniref:tRNA-intron lyase n=1 Tax=Rhynchospora pubera TaxID=906938 RepID=A0AAV8F2R0_9POAL|nr:tRNA-splicing endonuclease [Rhynchospora pubera]
MELSGPRWKGKNYAQIANSNPMSEIIAQLQVCLSNSESAALPIGTDFLLETEPELTDLFNCTSFGRQLKTSNGSKGYFQLSPEETFYLHHYLNCLKVLINNANLINVNDLWNFMRSRNELFPIYYRAYMHLRSKNWVVKSGTNNGVDYVVYRHHPELVHSEYAVIVDWEKESGEKEGGRLRVWSDLHCAVRACNGVAKAVLLLNVMGYEVKFSLPELLERMTVGERQITRWLPSQCRDDCKLDNDVEADDIDVASDKNVINHTTRYWVVPLQTQTQPEIGEEDSDYAPSMSL